MGNRYVLFSQSEKRINRDVLTSKDAKGIKVIYLKVMYLNSYYNKLLLYNGILM